MRLYIKGDYTKEIPFDYLELAKRMWFESYRDKSLSLSYSGYPEIVEDGDLAIHLKLNKQEYDERWSEVPIQEGIKYRFYSQIDEYLNLDYEDAYVTDFRENGDCLRLASTHLELLTLDKRAFYIMAIEIATAIDGQISEDDKETWLSIEEFKMRHANLLQLSYDKAVDISLEELEVMEAVDEPLWDDLHKGWEEYIKIHGERVYDDEDDE